jgi:hypothetical protein
MRWVNPALRHGGVTIVATTTNLDKIGESAQTIVRTSQDSAQILTDYFVKAQELNTQLAQRAVETWIEGLRRQTELSQDVARELFGRADEQVDAYRRFFGQWGNGFMSFPFVDTTNVAFPFQRQGIRLVKTVANSTQKTVETVTKGTEEIAETVTFPIAGYDEMNVAEISERLEGLSADELKRVREYEKRNKGRDTLIGQIDRKIRAASA